MPGGYGLDVDPMAEDEGAAATTNEDTFDRSEDPPLLEWAKIYRDVYLDEMIRHEGRAGVEACSAGCGGEGLYKCKDCFGFRLWCRECFVEVHSHLPLHRALVSCRSACRDE
jgi:hypothetical protein